MSEVKKFTNISPDLVERIGVQALSDRPNAKSAYGNAGMSAAELKAHFDNMSKVLADKINAWQEQFSTDEIAQYVRIALDDYEVGNLQDLVDAIFNGEFAEKLLMVFPTQNDYERKTLQEVIFGINKNIAERIKEAYGEIDNVRKLITDLGYGYTDADVVFIEDGGKVSADVVAEDDNGARRLIFTFRNFGKGVAEIALGIPLIEGEGENSIEQVESNNSSITERSISLGENNISGAKGYYFTEIYYGSETLNPQIKIDSVQPTNRGLYISPEALSKNPTFEAPNYAVGDVFSLICNDHFVLFGTITKIDHDIITFEGDIELFKSGLARMVSQGNAKMVEEYYVNLFPQYDDYTLCVPDKPINGIVEVCQNAFSSGYGNISAGEEGTALGAGTKVVGAYGHTSGKGTLAGYAANAEGSETQAPAKYSHAQNKGTKALGLASTAMGNATLAEGEAAVAEGNYTKALGPYSHSEGWLAEATGSATHAEGRQTIASGARAHAEGWSTIASAADSHAEGRETKATAGRAHSEGYLTEASGLESHAGGRGTKATATAQTAIGKYNKENPDALFIVGNGTSDNDRSNAFEVLKDGRVVLGEKSYGTEKLEAGVSALPTGALYFVYE
ncbi:MAG: hypothetical protein IKB02_09965 [Clostridia bacterium]|nr:hypothetical protein [Clostridia bacterium]MBR2389059.1 hypothetical protein [Clostridia bacterium]